MKILCTNAKILNLEDVINYQFINNNKQLFLIINNNKQFINNYYIY